MPAHRKPTHRPKVLAAAVGTALACSGVAFAVQGSHESVRSADPVTVTSAPSSPTSSSAVDENTEVRSPRPSRSARDGRAGPAEGRGDKAAKARPNAPTGTPTPEDEIELPVKTPPTTPAAETTGTAEQPVDPTPEPTRDTTTAGSGILGETNRARMNAGQPALSVSSCLADMAQRHAERIAAAQRLFHQDLNAVASACGMSVAGENVAMNYTGSSAMVDQWMNSSGHRANLLDGRFSLIGVGVAQARDGAWYGVQVFGDS